MRTLLAPVLLTLAVASGSLSAQDRLVRRFGGESGLVSTVVALAQDSTGFLWAGTRAGLFRYDGNRFERWAPEALPRAVGSVAVSPEGTVVVVDADGRILELSGHGARPLPGNAQRSPDHIEVATFDGAGRLWVITREGDVAWRREDGTWRTLPSADLAGDTVRKIFAAGTEGGVLVAGGADLWKVGPDAPPRRVLDAFRIVDALVLPDGRIAALSAAADVILVDGAAEPEVLTADASLPRMRGISLAERNGALWAAADRHLVVLRLDGSVEVMGPEHDVVAGGPLLVDHEGSLWHAGFTSLSQYPEPSTRVWDESHGLPSAHTRFLGRSGDALWVTTWQGTGYVRRTEGRWEAGTYPTAHSQGQICPDGDGGLWLGTRWGLQRLQGPQAATANTDMRMGFSSCAPAHDGGLWVGSGEGLYHLSADGAVLTPVSSFPYAGRMVEAILEDRSGRVWAASRDRICSAPAHDVRRGGSAEWSCQTLPPGVVHLNALVELASGTVWAASSTIGVLRHEDGEWRLLPDVEDLPTRAVLNLVPSPRGGVWLVGNGILLRVAERPGGPGWSVLEELGPWHGLPSVGGGHLLEEEDGTVWIATALGVIHVPAEVRAALPLPPRMAVVEARVDGERVPLEGPLVLPADRNRLELRIAALSFRDPGRVRYQMRLSREETWAETDGEPSFRWVDLPAGSHRPQVRASLDGADWSPEPAELAFQVLPPWYRTPRAMALFVVLAAGLLFALYRARLAYLLGLERQRTRIAMDLHDEMGSGLASIGILGSVLSSGAEGREGARIAREVAATAEELGAALSDIVWSLDPRSATLEELAARLAEHGERLFADEVEFDTDFPGAWPPRPLPLPVLRNVLLVGLEALHNAARHADAGRVLLSVRPEGEAWVLAVTDDGVGLPTSPAGRGNGRPERGGGRGRRGMRRRAAEIGGDIVWESRPGGGTTVRLRFELARRRPGLLRWMGGWKRRRARPRSSAPDSHEHASAADAPPVHR